MRNVLSIFSYALLVIAGWALPRLPEPSHKIMIAGGVAFVVLFSVAGSLLFMELEREIMPKDVAAEAAAIFASGELHPKELATEEETSTKKAA